MCIQCKCAVHRNIYIYICTYIYIYICTCVSVYVSANSWSHSRALQSLHWLLKNVEEMSAFLGFQRFMEQDLGNCEVFGLWSPSTAAFVGIIYRLLTREKLLFIKQAKGKRHLPSLNIFLSYVLKSYQLLMICHLPPPRSHRGWSWRPSNQPRTKQLRPAFCKNQRSEIVWFHEGHLQKNLGIDGIEMGYN